MGHWKNPNINLGVIKAGRAKRLVFYANDDIPQIQTIQPSCGCSVANYDSRRKQLVINYNNAAIPNQVIGPQNVNYKVDITYQSGDVEVLTFKAIKVRTW